MKFQQLRFSLVFLILLLSHAILILSRKYEGNPFFDFHKKGQKLRDLFEKITNCDKECGGVQPPLLKLNHVTKPRAICNDGSRASYYMHDARSKSWVLFLQPGWLCYDSITCFVRNNKNRGLTTSWKIPKNKTGEGVLRTDPVNRLFWKYNMVDINYCSSDLYLGNTTARSDVGVYFRGKEILFSVIHDLLDYHRLTNGHTLYLVGSSAGGVGILVNIEEILIFLESKGFGGIYIRVVLDDSWFTGSTSSNLPCYEGSPPLPCITNETLTEAFKVWNVKLNSACGEKFSENSMWNCIYASNAVQGRLNNLPFFVIQNQYDNYQMIMSKLLPLPEAETKQGILKRVSAMLEAGERVRSEVSSLPAETSGFFSMACLNHHTLRGDYVDFPIKVNSRSLVDALKCWLRNSEIAMTVSRILRNEVPRASGKERKSDCEYRAEDTCSHLQCNLYCLPLDTGLTQHSSVWTPEMLFHLTPTMARELAVYSLDSSSMQRLSNMARDSSG